MQALVFEPTNLRLCQLVANSFSISGSFCSLQVFDEFGFDDIRSVSGISVSGRGEFSGSSAPSLTSGTDQDRKSWSSFWNPIFGTCFRFDPELPVKDFVGQAGVEFVKVDLDFSAAFPVRPFPEMVSTDLAAKTDAAEAEDGNELKIIHP